MTSFRHSSSFGKRQEFVAIAELMRLGFDVYLTLVDDQGIDCIIRREVNGKLSYLDIQIKARSEDCKPAYAATFSMKIPKSRKNLWFIFRSEQLKTYWVMSSEDVCREATRGKSGKNAGGYKLVFANVSRVTGKAKKRPRFTEFENAFERLNH